MPGLGDLLHLVSGQTLLGSVRERHAQNLGSTGQRAAHIGPSTGSPAQPSKHDAGLRGQAVSVSAEAGTSGDLGRSAQETDPLEHAAYHDGSSLSHASGSMQHMHVPPGGQSSTEQPADVLDLYLSSDTGDHLIATAVRQRAVDAASQDVTTSSIDPGSRGHPDANADSSTSSDAAASVIRIYSADDEGGQMLCRVDQKGHIHPAKQLRPGVQHQILSSATPFVRSLHFVVHTGRVCYQTIHGAA